MITRNEIVDLLSVVTCYDNRNATSATVTAWCKAAELGRWTFDEALDAVHAHYAVSTEFLMPGHVTQRIRAARPPAAVSDPDAPQQLALTKPASEETRRRVVAQFRDFVARRAIPADGDR